MQKYTFKYFRKIQCPSIPVSSRQSVPQLQQVLLCTVLCTSSEWYAVTFLWFPTEEFHQPVSRAVFLFTLSHCHSVRFSPAYAFPVLTVSQKDSYVHSDCRRHHNGMLSLGFLWSYLQQSRKTGLARTILRSFFRFTGLWSTLIIYAVKLATTTCHSIDADRL